MKRTLFVTTAAAALSLAASIALAQGVSVGVGAGGQTGAGANTGGAGVNTDVNSGAAVQTKRHGGSINSSTNVKGNANGNVDDLSAGAGARGSFQGSGRAN